MQNWSQTFTQHTAQKRSRKNSPFVIVDWKQKTAMTISKKNLIFRKRCVLFSEELRIIFRTSFRFKQTSIFMRLTVKVNCAHNCSTCSELPPNCKTSGKFETFVWRGSLGSTKPDSSVTISSQKNTPCYVSNSVPLSLDVLLSHGTPFENQHGPLRCLKTQALV